MNIFHGPQRKIREAKRSPRSGCTVSSDNLGLVDDVATFDGWPEVPDLCDFYAAIHAGHPRTRRKVLCVKNDSTIFHFLPSFSRKASQPPTTIPPPTTELVETTSTKKVVNYLPPVGQQTTTMVYSVHMIDKGSGERKAEKVKTLRKLKGFKHFFREIDTF